MASFPPGCGGRNGSGSPGTPTQNAFIESQNRRFPNECLNEAVFANLANAGAPIARRRPDDNKVRPQS
ncbi:integrase core domain-containing protein [Ferruginivarius sediminum]|uniref:Integrase catalytic domain-containing protein n=1 Tax=Ferruginivarius sediminum TaxID=2661937 RepID=A0A369TA60_9PROT|nr:hypothetical protein DRB17_08170 [Ferruginivarius sediminum]